MNNSYLWAADDAKSGRCSIGVIGTERQFDPPDQLGDRWSADDAIAGRCLISEVGRPRRAPQHTIIEPEPADPEPLTPDPDTDDAQPVEPFRPLTKAERKQLLQEMTDKLLIKAHADPLAFADDASTQLNKLLDLAGKQDAGAVDVRQISIERFTELSLEDKDAALVDTLLSFVPEDARSSALERLGIDARTWDTMQGVRALQARINVLEGEKPT